MACGAAGQAQTLGDALNAPDLGWTTGGSSPWVAETDATHDGQAAATSGVIILGQSNWIETAVPGPAVVSFWWRTVCLMISSGLSFAIGGVQETNITGNVYWERCEFYVPPGAQALRWTMTANLGIQNQGWLDEVSISAPVPPVILTQPTNQTILSGATASFAATASGTGPLSFQWQQNGSDVAGATAAAWSIPGAEPADSGDYTVVVSSPCGAITSQVATLVVIPVVPTFTLQPASQAVDLGSNATFTAAATGSTPMTWQWLANGQALEGATNASLTLTNVGPSDAGNYMTIAANLAGMTTSQVATLTVYASPVLTQQPVSLGVPTGTPATFAAGARGAVPLSWQWYFNGEAVPGATNATLTLPSTSPSDYGNYWALVTNGYGSATSTVAVLGFSPVIAWGDNSWDQSLVPPGATNVVALTGGDSHCLALLANGRVVAWGGNYTGQTDVPADLTNAVGIAAGSWHSLALRGDGTVVLWGYISYPGVYSVPPEATNVVALALGPGAQHALGLRADGTVLEWGNTNYGLLNVPIAATNIVAVAAGAYHSLALRADGKVVAWGDTSGGQTRVPASASNVVAVSSGWFHNLALRADGKLVQWGASNYGSVGSVPGDATNIVAFACGGNHSLALRADGKLLAWGVNTKGQTSIPPWATNLVAVAGTGFNSLALTGDGVPRMSCLVAARSVLIGGTAYFRAAAVGALPLAYQWQLNGTNLPGATGAVLVFSNAQPASAGMYSVVVSNGLGTVTSPGGLLAVLPNESLILSQSLSLTNSRFGFLATGPAGLKWSLQTSTNLYDWVDVGVLTNATGTMLCSGPATNSSRGFYRLRLTP
jgi:hypothetical protein